MRRTLLAVLAVFLFVPALAAQKTRPAERPGPRVRPNAQWSYFGWPCRDADGKLWFISVTRHSVFSPYCFKVIPHNRQRGLLLFLVGIKRLNGLPMRSPPFTANCRLYTDPIVIVPHGLCAYQGPAQFVYVQGLMLTVLPGPRVVLSTTDAVKYR